MLMDLQGIILSEICQAEKEKYHMVSPMCGTYKTKQNKNRVIEGEQRDGYQKGGGRGMGAKGKGNIVNNIVISLQGDQN